MLNKPVSKTKAASYNVSFKGFTTEKPDLNSKLKSGVCWFCNSASHKLVGCKDFLDITVKERFTFVKTNKLCHKCLSSKHRTSECKRSDACEVEGCIGKFHHTLLHYTNKETKPKSSTYQDKGTSTSETNSATSCTVVNQPAVNTETNVCLCVVPIIVQRDGKELATYAFLDQGSTHTFCDQNLIDFFDIHGSHESLSIQTLNGVSKDHSTISCKLRVSDLAKQEYFTLSKVFVVDKIPVRPNSVCTKLLRQNYLDGVELHTVTGASVSILIGADVPEMFCVKSFRKGPQGSPVAVETPVGWSLLGPSLSPSFNTNCQVNFVRKSDDEIEKMVSDLWDADFQTSTSILNIPHSSEDRAAYGKLTSSVTVTSDGHYQLPLLWKDQEPSLPNNIPMAKRRLLSLKKRLSKNPSLKQKYKDVIDTYLAKGYAKQIPTETPASDKTWYLPHHPVIHPFKAKIRVVFDCAAEYCNTSLNHKLVRGPDLMNSLISVLLKFRKEPIALVADVEQMFHQVFVNPEDREALRFLWWPDGDLDKEPVLHQMTVHIFGAKSSPCCANFCLQQTAKEFGHLSPSSISDIVFKNFYVDDCLVSLSSVEEAIAVQQKLTELLVRRGFRLRKWVSNKDEVLRTIPESERSSSVQGHTIEDSTKERLLGMLWTVKEDAFTFAVNLPERPLARRGILSALSSLYDPLGFVSPVILEGRLLLQSLCKRKAQWDEEVTSLEANKWLQWINRLPAISSLNIRRCLKPTELEHAKKVEIHNFSDASSYAYGACTYLRAVGNNGACYCSLLIGKARLAPIKAVSIPRLELTAAVLAVRLNAVVKNALEAESCVSKFWTDSMAVLHCIQNKTKRFPPFVANRLAVIEENSNIEN